MSYEILLHRRVVSCLANLKGGYYPQHLKNLEKTFAELQVNPHIGTQFRDDLANAYHIDMGEYRLYYYVDEPTQETRFFRMEKYFHSCVTP
jgi:mRNA-degrading endonuclease RelE of RelBE toxin-antitoxin system